MQCLKCGRRIEDGQVFCADCLQVMEATPVKSDAAVVIPNRPALRRSDFAKAVKPEEIIDKLQHTIHRLTIACICLGVLLAAALVGMGLLFLSSSDIPGIGQNYSTFAPSDPLDSR